jgi:hypothetical protein
MHRSSATFLSTAGAGMTLVVLAASPVACSAPGAPGEARAGNPEDTGKAGDSAIGTSPDAGAPPAEGGSDSGPSLPFTLGQRPFTPTSSWNTPIAASATLTR